jgi:hypothetical protein
MPRVRRQGFMDAAPIVMGDIKADGRRVVLKLFAETVGEPRSLSE